MSDELATETPHGTPCNEYVDDFKDCPKLEDFRSPTLCKDHEIKRTIEVLDTIKKEYKEEYLSRKRKRIEENEDKETIVYTSKKRKCFAFEIKSELADVDSNLFKMVSDDVIYKIELLGVKVVKVFNLNHYLIIKVKKPVVFNEISFKLGDTVYKQVCYTKVLKYISQ